MSGVTRARLRSDGMKPLERDRLTILVIVGRRTSRISFFVRIRVGMGSRGQDVFAEFMMISQTHSLSTLLNTLNVESHASLSSTDIGETWVSFKSVRIFSIFESKKS